MFESNILVVGGCAGVVPMAFSRGEGGVARGEEDACEVTSTETFRGGPRSSGIDKDDQMEERTDGINQRHLQ